MGQAFFTSQKIGSMPKKLISNAHLSLGTVCKRLSFVQKFLSSQNPPIKMTVDEENQLKRWHPEFPLNSVPDVKPYDLPIAPTTSKIYSAKEMFQKTTTNPRLPARVMSLSLFLDCSFA